MWYTFRNQVMVTEFGIVHVRAKQRDEQQILSRTGWYTVPSVI